MSKIIRFKNKKMLGGYSNAEQRKIIPENALFFAGLAVSIVLPEAVYCFLGGPVRPTAFAVIALSGLVWGCIRYRRQESRTNFLDTLGILPSVPRAENRPRKAA